MYINWTNGRQNCPIGTICSSSTCLFIFYLLVLNVFCSIWKVKVLMLVKVYMYGFGKHEIRWMPAGSTSIKLTFPQTVAFVTFLCSNNENVDVRTITTWQFLCSQCCLQRTLSINKNQINNICYHLSYVYYTNLIMYHCNTKKGLVENCERGPRSTKCINK